MLSHQPLQPWSYPSQPLDRGTRGSAAEDNLFIDVQAEGRFLGFVLFLYSPCDYDLFLFVPAAALLWNSWSGHFPLSLCLRSLQFSSMGKDQQALCLCLQLLVAWGSFCAIFILCHDLQILTLPFHQLISSVLPNDCANGYEAGEGTCSKYLTLNIRAPQFNALVFEGLTFLLLLLLLSDCIMPWLYSNNPTVSQINRLGSDSGS